MPPAVAPHPASLDEPMGEEITRQQRRLEEHDAGPPHQITASIMRQKHFGDDQLYLK